MSLVYLISAVAALIVYGLTSRFGFTARVVITLLVFAVPSVTATVWVFMVGDKAPSDAVIVHPNGERASPSEKNDKINGSK